MWNKQTHKHVSPPSIKTINFISTSYSNLGHPKLIGLISGGPKMHGVSFQPTPRSHKSTILFFMTAEIRTLNPGNEVIVIKLNLSDYGEDNLS